MKNNCIRKIVALMLCFIMISTACVFVASADDGESAENSCVDGKHDLGFLPVEVIVSETNNSRILVYKCRLCSELVYKHDGDKEDSKSCVIVFAGEVEPTCEEVGYYSYFCTVCSETVERVVIPATGHVDEDGDGVCDVLGCGGSIIIDGVVMGCGCQCHAEDAFGQLFYKILSFIWKILGSRQSCACGNVHY